jgi:uncharacterized protein YqfA (UPF0365 family)
MATPIYVVTIAALIVLSLAVPGLVWWSALAAVVATALWYYFRLRDAELDRRESGVAGLEGDALGSRRGTDVDD